MSELQSLEVVRTTPDHRPGSIAIRGQLLLAKTYYINCNTIGGLAYMILIGSLNRSYELKDAVHICSTAYTIPRSPRTVAHHARLHIALNVLSILPDLLLLAVIFISVTTGIIHFSISTFRRFEWLRSYSHVHIEHEIAAHPI